MDNWFLLALVTLVTQGLKDFLYKVSAEHKCNTALVNFFWALTVAFFSLLFILLQGKKFVNFQSILLMAFFGGLTYSMSSILRMESLKHLATSVAFPLLRLSVFLTVIFSFFYFKDSLSFRQFIGIIVGFSVVFLVSKQHESEKIVDKNFKLGIFLIILAIFFGTISSIIPKFAAVSFEPLSFMLLTYTFNSIFSLFLVKKMKDNKYARRINKAILLGCLMGVLNFIGFYSLLVALSVGPLSIIILIQSFSFLIAIIFSVFIYREKIGLRRFVGIILAITAVILMK